MQFEATISLAALFAVMIRKWKGICITMLVFMLLLGGYQGYKQYGLANDPENSPEKIEERYETALEDYETRKKDLQKTLENQEKSLADKEEYLEKSIFIQIDPYDKYIANIVFTFSNIDESAQLFRYPNTAADYLPKKIRSQYVELWRSMDVPRDIGIAKYADTEWKYLSEIVSVNSLEGELLSIQAFGSTAADAEELADAIYSYFDAHRDVISAGSARHSFTLVNRTTKSVIDEGLSTKQENLKKEIEDLKTAIENSKQSIEDLEEPVREEGYTVAAIIKSVMKYTVLGAVVGIFLACTVVCCWWILADKVSDSFQLERVIGAPFLGSLRIPRSLAERLAATVIGERIWKDTEQAAAYISEQAKAGFPKDGTVLLLSTLPETLACKEMEELTKIFFKGGYDVVPVMDAVHNPKAVEFLQNCVGVVFLEMAEKSSITAVSASVLRVKNAKKPIMGIITL